MLTLHTAERLRTGPGEQPAPGGAVAVDGAVIVAVGPLDELTAGHPRARVRRWPGTLGPGLVQHGTRELLQETYHPDPRDPERPGDRGESVRRGIHALLRRGVTAVADDSTDPAVGAALSRSGLARVPAGAEAAVLRPGARADLAVFDSDGTCVATVLAGRLVHRRT